MTQAVLQLRPGIDHSGCLESIIPFRMPNGFLIKQMSDLCVSCGHEIDQDKWAVDVSWLGKSCAVFRMEAQCPECGGNEVRNIRFRIHADGRLDMDECKNGSPWKIFKNLPRASNGEPDHQQLPFAQRMIEAFRRNW